MDVMVEWPGRCSRCRQPISDWGAAGLHEGRWVHKECFILGRMESDEPPDPEAVLRSPVERSAQLEWPMLLFLLLFHFGLGGAVIGWIMISQNSPTTGAIILATGIITPLIGIAGVAVNIVSRRRIETIRQELELQGGWKPGR